MKTFYCMISKQFMKGHPRAGEPTNFLPKIWKGLPKIHRMDKEYTIWSTMPRRMADGHWQIPHTWGDDMRDKSFLPKIHTIRDNYQYWARIAVEVNAGRGILSLRQWTKSPYNFQRDGSKQEEFSQLIKMGVQPIRLMNGGVVLNGKEIPWYEFDDLYINDGFKYFDDFYHWFCPPLKNRAIGRVLDKQACIIHFTDFRY